jgi:high-affinity iron transporter
VLSSLFTGVLGVQPRPTVAELTAWLLYAAPMLVYVALPRRRKTPPRTVEEHADRTAVAA